MVGFLLNDFYIFHKSSEFDYMVEIHWGYFAVLACTEKSLLYLILCLLFLLFWKFLIILAHSVDWKKLININRSSSTSIKYPEGLNSEKDTSASSFLSAMARSISGCIKILRNYYWEMFVFLNFYNVREIYRKYSGYWVLTLWYMSKDKRVDF